MTRVVKAGAAESELITLPRGGKLRRDPNRARHGWVTCPDCPEPKKERYVRVPAHGSAKLQTYSGRCTSCENRRRWAIAKSTGEKWCERVDYYPARHKYPTKDIPIGDYGSQALWSKYRGGRYVSVKCGECREEHPIIASVALKPGRTGVCKECYRKVLSSQKKYTHEQMLPKGTKVLWHTRAPGQRHKVGIECRGCFKETGQIKFVGDKQIQNHVKGLLYWDELCSDCVRKRGRSLRKFTTAQTAPSGTVTHFENVVNGEVLIVYGNPDKGCGCERWVDRDTAASWWKRYPAVCKIHYSNPADYLARRMQLMNNAKEMIEKRGRGRRKGTQTWDRPAFLADVENLIKKVRREKEFNDEVTSESVAEQLQFKGITISGKGLVARLRDCGVKESWPKYRERIIRGAGQN